VLIAITGTPGTGKSSACAVLERRGYAVVDLNDAARKESLVVGRDEARQTDEVDVDALRARLLRERLAERGWPEAKIRENVEAEAIDVVLQEAVGRLDRVYEVDTTYLSPEQTATEILEILQGKTEGHTPGSVDWSEEVLSWY